LQICARGADDVLLGPLGTEEVADLAGEVAGLPPGPGLLKQLAGTGGNPRFVIELVRALAGDGALDMRDGRAEARSVSSPPTLRLSLLRRLSRLPEDGLNLLRVASILGSSFSLAELTLLTDRSSAQLLSALHPSLDAGLIIESGDRLGFRHELVRDAIYHDLPVSVRKGMHRDAGAVLEGCGAPVERVAGHGALGAEIGDTRSIEWLREAAATAAARAPATAVRVLERALEICDASDPLRQTLAAEMVMPLLAAGRLREAESIARGVLAVRPAPGVEVMTRTGLAGVLSMGARYPEAIAELEQAAVAAPEDERESLSAAGSLLLVLAGQIDRARDAAHRAVVDGERVGNDYALCLGLETLALVALAEGFVGEAVMQAQRAVMVAQRSDGVWANYVVPLLWHGTALADADQFGEAAAAFHAGRSRAEQTGNVSRLPLYHWAIAELRLNAGQWDDALTEAQAGLGLIDETGNQVGDVFANAVCAHIAFHRSEPTLAQAAVDEARRRLVAGPVEIGFEWMSWVGALLLEAQGERARALANLETAWDLIAPVRYLQAAARPMGPDLVRLALAAGDRGARHFGYRRVGAQRPAQSHSDCAGYRVSLSGSSRGERGLAPRGGRCAPRWAPALPAGCRLRRRRDRPRAHRQNRRSGPAPERSSYRVWTPRGRPGFRPGPIRIARPWCPTHPTGDPTPALLRMGKPHPDRAAGRRLRHRGSHQPRYRRATVRVTTHGRHSPGARIPEAGTRQPRRTGRGRGTPSSYRPDDFNKSDNTRSKPSQPTKRTSRPPARLTRPAGGSVASSQIVITTTGS
jgi:tetratricopeptide (TPR) repeat protein